MFTLKRISKDSIHAALDRAERYRLLNEPAQAESICHDILEVDPQNQKAMVMLILALTDQFNRGSSVSSIQPQSLLPQLRSQYEQKYYAGLILERRGKSRLAHGSIDANFIAYDLFMDAMEYYEQAEAMHPPGNDDAALRWNTCARMIMKNKLVPKDRDKDEVQPFLE